MGKKYKPFFDVEYSKNTINDIVLDKKEFDDWTQISLSVRDAVIAAQSVFGNETDEQIDNLMRFASCLGNVEMQNVLHKYDITFKKKGE